MEVVHLNQKQLAARWHLSEACLKRWRSEGIGPKFMKQKGRVLYRQVDSRQPALIEIAWTDKATLGGEIQNSLVRAFHAAMMLNFVGKRQ